MYNQFLQDLEAYSIGFSIDLVQSFGKTVIDNISDTLWYLDSHYEKSKDQHLVIPIPFTKYKDVMIIERITNLSHIFQLPH